MFYEIFEKLCKEKNTSPFACCKAVGLAGGTAAYWKKSGKIPKRESLEKIAEYLGCSVDYLLGREESPKFIEFESDGEAAEDFNLADELRKLLGYDSEEKEEKKEIGIDFGTTYSIHKQKSAPNDLRSVKPEPIIIKASESDWDKILSQMSDESLVMLRDYAKYLLWRQVQAAADIL